MAAAPEKNNANKAEHEGGGAKKTYSPYDLNASDNPGNIITQVQLCGENYDEWARAVKISLRARRKWGFIDGTHIQPEDEAPDLEDWWTVQSMIVSWILNTIEPSLRSIVAYAETAHNLWEDIKERFSVVNGPRIQQLRSDLSRCKQEGMMVATYFGKLKVLWDELANSDKIPSCTCGGCKCGIGAQLEKRREEEKVHQLLMGLDDASYGTVRSNILALDPLSSLNRVYAILVQEERVRMMAKSTEERGLVVGLAMQANYKEKGRGDMVEKLMTCSHCDQKVKANGTAGDAKGCETKVTRHVQMWHTLVEATVKPTMTTINLRCGASNHMTGSLENLSEKETIQGCPVGLPDGERVLACEQGTVTLEEGLELKNDCTSRTLIGAGERKDGLYWYRGVRKTQACHVKMENQLALWHQRLGHPSFKIVQMLPDISGKFASSNLDECIVNQPIASLILAKEDATLTDDFDHTINDSDPCIEASTLPADPLPRPTETAPSVSSPPLTVAVPLGRGHRAKLPSVRLRDFVAATTIPSSPSVPSPPSTESSGNNGTAIQCFKGYLNQCFHMKDLGRLKYFLGLKLFAPPTESSFVKGNMP
ncbi:uncharacterized protein [Phaseolus vulgaris]|uniref:uncharacterized protein n=1 Tax=Phaseolus vulgaris TaxID=3885 RepID=UPI0035CB5B24